MSIFLSTLRIFTKDGCENYVSTPNHGVWDKTLYDSTLERDFAADAARKLRRRVLPEIPFMVQDSTPIGLTILTLEWY